MENKEKVEAVICALKEFGVEYELYTHKAVFTVEEMNELDLPRPEAGAKNLFLRDDKKRNYYLLTVKEDRPINLKEVRKKMGVRPLSFASEDDLSAKLGLTRGSVTPLGVINNTDHDVKVYIDADFRGGEISVHPNSNEGTIYLSADKLAEFIKAQGNPVEFFEY